MSPKADRAEVIKRFESDVIPFIDKDKSNQAALALLYIIKCDHTLHIERKGENAQKFQACIGGKSVQDFLNPKKYDLSETLASIFLYTVTAVENNVGQEWLQKISSDMKKEKKTYEDFFASYVAKFAEGGRSNKRDPERIADVFWCEIENFPVEKNYSGR